MCYKLRIAKSFFIRVFNESNTHKTLIAHVHIIFLHVLLFMGMRCIDRNLTLKKQSMKSILDAKDNTKCYAHQS